VISWGSTIPTAWSTGIRFFIFSPVALVVLLSATLFSGTVFHSNSI
jgi:hypothetical protein